MEDEGREGQGKMASIRLLMMELLRVNADNRRETHL